MESLLKDLDASIKSGDHAKILENADKVLASAPNDADAKSCKIVSLIQTNQFDSAIKTIDSFDEGNYQFEKAYALFRLKKFDESLKVLSTLPQPKSVHALQLEAQVYHRLEQNARAVEVFDGLIKEHKINTSEVKTNLAAAHAGAASSSSVIQKLLSEYKTVEEGHDFSYNVACGYISTGNYEEAKQYLQRAENQCRATQNPEDLQDELSSILCQRAFIQQLLGQKDEAAEIYNKVLKTKPSDETVVAVADNNLVALKKDGSLFDSQKKLKHAAALEAKLTSEQKRVINYNRALVSLFMNKVDECREQVNNLINEYPTEYRYIILKSSLLYKEKKFDESLKVLEDFKKKNGKKRRNFGQVHDAIIPQQRQRHGRFRINTEDNWRY